MELTALLDFQAIPAPMVLMELMGHQVLVVTQVLMEQMEQQAHQDLAGLADILVQDCQVFLGLLAQALLSMQQQA
jgi:hypothetical protein